MISLILLVLILAIAAILILALAGIVAVAWPVLIILGIGLIIDIIIFKLIFRKKGWDYMKELINLDWEAILFCIPLIIFGIRSKTF